MNSGGSNHLNHIKIDPRKGKKFSFTMNLSLVEATVWQFLPVYDVIVDQSNPTTVCRNLPTMHFQSCTFIHAFYPIEAVSLLYGI